MAYPTAIELVNRVLTRLRGETVSSFGDKRSTAVLEYVNAAKDDVLSGRDWKDDIRHDGVLLTRAAISSSSVEFITETAFMQDAALFGKMSDFSTDVIARVEYTGDTDSNKSVGNLAGTVWRVPYLFDFSSKAVGAVDANWPGATTSTATGKHFVAEYMLPDTVREVVSITHTNGAALKLRHVDPGATFDSWFPDLTDRYASPEYAAVGGFDHPTSTSASVTLDPLLRLILFPIPDDVYRLNYSYYYSHPTLVNSTDVLEVSPEVASHIVAKAYADAVAGTQQRVNDGLMLGAVVERQVDRLHRSSDRQPARRHTVNSWEGATRRTNVTRGFPGVTIEG